ncbi:response regulator transcription factor [Paenibacillus sediminis]|uniref:Heme response regulator HssR n=1 Tax=Paenibacillus sediminis TaxID=664909 RepID=A0ABS4H3M9_9BACL|nr:response regulator transcription factor [Paenibacillus sediminis]MBP1937142.1 DNA-binding response OmpR family regulator [Paenibacillus sediminis]
MVKILIADDDPSILELLRLYLTKEGYEVRAAADGRETLSWLEQESFDLVILDIMMPYVDGWQLCQEIRRYYGDIAILFVSAKGESEDKINGFKLGTDDYVVKPFDPDELVMRVRALLRRYRIYASESVTIGALTLEASTKFAKTGSQTLPIPAKEFDLLYMLSSYPNQVFTRDQLIEKIWGPDFDGDERTIDVHIKRLRTRFPESLGFRIQTIRGIGYRLEVNTW